MYHGLLLENVLDLYNLACGDLSVAAELVRKHPVRGQTVEDDQVSDLMCFAVSDEYAKLRGRLGVAIA